MRVHRDKVETGPPHALGVRDVRLIFKAAPPDWTKAIKEVRIANRLGGHTFFSRFDGCLTIYSRGITREAAIAIVLSELAAISLNLDRGLRSRPKAVRNRLTKMTAGLRQQLLPIIVPPTRLGAPVSLKGFKELKFPFVPNDSE